MFPYRTLVTILNRWTPIVSYFTFYRYISLQLSVNSTGHHDSYNCLCTGKRNSLWQLNNALVCTRRNGFFVRTFFLDREYGHKTTPQCRREYWLVSASHARYTPSCNPADCKILYLFVWIVLVIAWCSLHSYLINMTICITQEVNKSSITNVSYIKNCLFIYGKYI